METRITDISKMLEILLNRAQILTKAVQSLLSLFDQEETRLKRESEVLKLKKLLTSVQEEIGSE